MSFRGRTPAGSSSGRQLASSSAQSRLQRRNAGKTFSPSSRRVSAPTANTSTRSSQWQSPPAVTNARKRGITPEESRSTSRQTSTLGSPSLGEGPPSPPSSIGPLLRSRSIAPCIQSCPKTSSISRGQPSTAQTQTATASGSSAERRRALRCRATGRTRKTRTVLSPWRCLRVHSPTSVCASRTITSALRRYTTAIFCAPRINAIPRTSPSDSVSSRRRGRHGKVEAQGAAYTAQLRPQRGDDAAFIARNGQSC
mmetsp:Transcript_59281/g.165508  ORF Transcript_59281/g.165508 Transcript_59281/m.165508 type:complete len:254 (+) Transcript_59281:66-827(+)